MLISLSSNRSIAAALLVALVAPGGFGAEPGPFVDALGVRLMPIQAGQFSMGQNAAQLSFRRPWSEEKDRGGDGDERPVHHVKISRDFLIGVTEITNRQYEQFDPAHRAIRVPAGTAGDDDAVAMVSWLDAQRFCGWLSAREGATYRLPTEAEWEYACRAGSQTLFSFGDQLPAGYQPMVKDQLLAFDIWFPDASKMPVYYRMQEKVSLKVAQGPHNAWGLFDMHGNVEEWCGDWYGPYAQVDQMDPRGPAQGNFRVVRGGGHSQVARLLRSANRSGMLPGIRTGAIGFRVVRETQSAPAMAAGAQPDLGQPAGPALTGPTNIRENHAAPCFQGPIDYVHIAPGSVGPLFSKHNHDAGIDVCPNGDLLAIWCTCEEEPGAELAIASSRLKLGSKEWEPAALFWDIPDKNDTGPAIWNDGAGTLFHFNGNKDLHGSVFRTSQDSGVTWNPAQSFSKFTQVNEGIIRTIDGRILVTLDGPNECTVVEASSDNGRTWDTQSGAEPAPMFAPGHEGRAIAGIHAGIVQLRDGRLLAMGRFDNLKRQHAFSDKIAFSLSTDGGNTWKYSESPFPAISSSQRLTFKRLREGPLLVCAYTDIPTLKDSQGRRIGAKPLSAQTGMELSDGHGGTVIGYGLFAAVSFDEGQTWPVRRLITGGGQAHPQVTMDGNMFDMSDTTAEPLGYLAMCQDAAGDIHLISSRNYYRFNLAWLTAGAESVRK